MGTIATRSSTSWDRRPAGGISFPSDLCFRSAHTHVTPLLFDHAFKERPVFLHTGLFGFSAALNRQKREGGDRRAAK